jgi:hypothetical protein
VALTGIQNIISGQYVVRVCVGFFLFLPPIPPSPCLVLSYVLHNQCLYISLCRYVFLTIDFFKMFPMMHILSNLKLLEIFSSGSSGLRTLWESSATSISYVNIFQVKVIIIMFIEKKNESIYFCTNARIKC